MSEVPELSSIKPRSKPILTQDEVISFEQCLIEENPTKTLRIEQVIPGAFYIDNVLTQEECTSLIKEINHSSSLSFWCQGKEDDESVRSFRNAKTIEIHSDLFCGTIWSRIESLFNNRSDFIVHISPNPEDEDFERDLVGDWFPKGLNPDSLFVRYPSFGSFAPHTDGRAIIDFNTRSHYSVVLFLNSVEKHCGAGTRFYEESVVKQLKKEENRWTGDSSLVLAEVEAVAGRFLFFHQSLVHEGVPPAERHLKYIIRSDIIYERSPKICNSEKDRQAYQIFRQAEEVAENGFVEQSLQLFKKAFKLSPLLAEIMGQA